MECAFAKLDFRVYNSACQMSWRSLRVQKKLKKNNPDDLQPVILIVAQSFRCQYTWTDPMECAFAKLAFRVCYSASQVSWIPL